jgi:hypothetical protein
MTFGRAAWIAALALAGLVAIVLFSGIPDLPTILKERTFISGLSPGRSRASIVAAAQQLESLRDGPKIAIGRFRNDGDHSNSLDVSFLTRYWPCLAAGDDIIMTFTPDNKLVSWKRGDAGDGC